MSDRASQILNDFRPEVRSLLNTLKTHGFTLRAVDDGEELTETKDLPAAEVVKLITGVDQCTLRVTREAKRESTKTPGTMVFVRYSVALVLGNSPGELMADWSVPSHQPDADALDAAANEHGKRWEGRKQPTATARELFPTIYA